jgi:Ras-related protein Rab-8A
MYKILLIGDTATGKSSLLLRYIEGSFETLPSTLGFDFKLKAVEMEHDQQVKLQIWDTAGQERFRTITKAYYRGAQGIVIVFSLTDRKSFENVPNWYNNVQRNLGDSMPSMVLVGSHCDRQDKVVTNEEALEVAASLGLPYFECSSLTGHNVGVAFWSLAAMLHSKYNSEAPSPSLSRSPVKGNIVGSDGGENINLKQSASGSGSGGGGGGGGGAEESCC